MRKASRLLTLFALAVCCQAANKVDRVVILKVDGLPADFYDRFVAESPDRFPWIRKIFAENGTWMDNFYVRGLSLSAPSWSMLDTGRHLKVRGNVEYDRYTLRAYDYLNFFPFYVGYAFRKRADMTAVELLDAMDVPLLIDRFGFTERLQSPQLLGRAIRWTSLTSTLKRAFGGSPKQIFDEWQAGFTLSDKFTLQTEQELIDGLSQPELRYLDFFAIGYDHTAHLTADGLSQMHTLEHLDQLAGRIWSAIAGSPYPNSTLFVLVSDHGMNTSEGIYSQGFNLVDWFASAAGGGNHVLTNRYPLHDYTLKSLNAFVSEVITPSTAPGYLSDMSALYPTAMLDLDGNERASLGLRSNTFNQLQILLDQLMHKRLPGPVRNAALNAFFRIRDEHRQEWERDLDSLAKEMDDLGVRIEELQKITAKHPKSWTKEQHASGADQAGRRALGKLDDWKLERRAYLAYAATMRRLLALDPADFDPGKFKMETLIPAHSLGPQNSLDDLQHYVTGASPSGLVIDADGHLDLQRSFSQMNYFDALESLRVRNNVQKEVGTRPIDFTALRVPYEGAEAVLMRRGPDKQALILTRRRADGTLELRYQPKEEWTYGLPLELWEDPDLDVPLASRVDWLNAWHTEREWLQAVHRTRYSNGIIGLVEELLDLDPPRGDTLEDKLRARESRLRRTDLLIVGADHWNFNTRGFNPGGNHGSFLRVSTHSVLLFAGAGIPRGQRVETPYDSLSFVPTVLTLLGRPEHDLPGPLILEVLPTESALPGRP